MDRPYIICHMLTALDGKITGTFMETSTAAIAGEEYERINEMYKPNAWLCGRVTTDENFTFYHKPNLEENVEKIMEEDFVAVNDAKMYYVSVDASGKIGWTSNTLHYAQRPAAHIIEVLTEKASNSYKAFLHKLNISYITAGKDKLDCLLATKKLKKFFNINTLMVSGGGFINWAFLNENLIDEISLVIAPIADGDSKTVTLFERADYLPEKLPTEFTLKSVQKLIGNGVWLNYILNK